MKVYRFITIFVLFISFNLHAQNVFFARDYWKANPSIAQIEKDIKAGNDPTELNANAFDAISWALIEKSDNNTVKFLLDIEGNGVNKRTHDGRTYIFWAAYKGNLEMMEYLVSKGAKTDLIDSHGYSVLNFIAATGQLDTKIYDFCIAHGANPAKELDHNGANALLLLAPFLQDDTFISYFTAKGVDLHTTDAKGNGIFNYAAKKGNKEFLQLLIEKGVAYKNLNKEGGNAFIFASQGTRGNSNTLETYKYLESLGLQPNIVTNKGVTPLHALAYRNKDLEIFNYFISKGVDIDQADSNGNTPFLNAAFRNNLEIVSYFANYTKKINTANKEGRTALMLATMRNSPEVVNFLIQKNANTTLKDAAGNDLSYYLLESYSSRRPEIFEQKLATLTKKGLKLNAKQAKNNTLYHLAAKKNNLDLLKKLASFNIGINAKNDEGNTALHIAAMKAEDDTILKYLISKGADKNIKTGFEESVYDLAIENELLQKHNVALNFLK